MFNTAVEQPCADRSVYRGIADSQRVILKLQPVRFPLWRPVMLLFELADRLPVVDSLCFRP